MDAAYSSAGIPEDPPRREKGRAVMKLPRCAGGNAEGKSRYELPLRVICCARVSAEKGKKINSLENQIQYYKELIQSKPNGMYTEGCVEDTAIPGLKSELQ